MKNTGFAPLAPSTPNRGTVYYRDIPAGTLERSAAGYVFRYDDAYRACSRHQRSHSDWKSFSVSESRKAAAVA